MIEKVAKLSHIKEVNVLILLSDCINQPTRKG